MHLEARQLAPEDFPPLLQEIPDPPKRLYATGSFPPPEHKLLCVVGSRKYSPYGKQACVKLIQGLAGFPISIVSGLALGIDAIAHAAALEVGLHTIAVPGSGLSPQVLYPATNRQLALRIVESGGLLLSEFEPDFRATPYSFPQRNRIMAGLSHAILIIEATERSGTLITARLALDYNRDVLAVPGQIFSAQSYGTHQLIKNGATPIRESADILEALGFDVHTAPVISLERLSPDERRIVEMLDEPRSRDDLCDATGLPIEKLNIVLSTMELKGILSERLGLLQRNI
jgi:DNA processing protein